VKRLDIREIVGAKLMREITLKQPRVLDRFGASSSSIAAGHSQLSIRVVERNDALDIAG